jgi:hypothetical protein
MRPKKGTLLYLEVLYSFSFLISDFQLIGMNEITCYILYTLLANEK